MHSAADFAWLIPLLPLCGAVLIGLGLISFNDLFNRSRKPIAITLLSSVGASACISYAVLVEQLSGKPPVEHLFIWASAGSFELPMGYVIDPLAAVMLALVTTIAFLVMIYSHGYMAHDPGYVRFFTYLALFSSSMLGLIVSPNLLEIYVFWATGSFDFHGIALGLSEAVNSGTVPIWAALTLCILVFMGPMAKSAQFPLHVWLPDAMEGPTPISALIHAATMVAAGVFLVARLDPLFSQFPFVGLFIAIIGTVTCFLGASIALIQMDLKKGLAYSTVSQLGYMMLAMGCGAPVAGMFHLVTHACFKAMLFLGSGSVIHAMEEVVGHEPILAQDMRLMGGLREKMPITAITFFIGCIAISGIPPLAGFWSKDEILGQAFNSFPALWFIGFLTAGMTAFYMFRLYFLTFEGDFRGENQEMQLHLLALAGKEKDEEHEDHQIGKIHESAWPMTFPLAVLAIPSVLIGFIGVPWNSIFANLLEPQEAIEAAEKFSWGEFLPLAIASVLISSGGILLAVLTYYLKRLDLGVSLSKKYPQINLFLQKKWYLDEINEKIFVKGSRKLAREVLEVDAKVVDGVVNLTGLLTLGSGEGLKYFETGRAQFYALIVFGGVIALVALFGVVGA